MKSYISWDDPRHRYALYNGHRLPVLHADHMRRDGDSNVILEPWEQHGKDWAEALAIRALEEKMAVLGDTKDRLRCVVAVRTAFVAKTGLYVRLGEEVCKLRERAVSP